MSNKIEILYFSTSWCGPCKMFKPAFQQFAEGYPDIEFKYIDLEDKQMSDEYKHLNVNSVPTVIFLKDGVEETRTIGVKSKKILEQILEDITF